MLQSKWSILATNCYGKRQTKQRMRKTERDREREKRKRNTFVTMFLIRINAIYIYFLGAWFRRIFWVPNRSGWLTGRKNIYINVQMKREEKKSMRATFIHKSTSFECLRNVRVFSIELPMFWIFRANRWIFQLAIALQIYTLNVGYGFVRAFAIFDVRLLNSVRPEVIHFGPIHFNSFYYPV